MQTGLTIQAWNEAEFERSDLADNGMNKERRQSEDEWTRLQSKWSDVHDKKILT